MTNDPSGSGDRRNIRRFSSQPPAQARPRVLDTGSGSRSASRLHDVFSGWAHVRLDIDPAVGPDLVGSICDMKQLVADQSFDAIWASHNLEHLHTHEVGRALREFRRILKPDGFAFVTCPDLEAVAEGLLANGAKATAYESPAGPISALDMIFGHGRSIAAGNLFMCHKTGFTQAVLGETAMEAGFAEARVGRGTSFDLWALFLMPETRFELLSKLLEPTRERFLVVP